MELRVISYNCRGLPNHTDSLYTRPGVSTLTMILYAYKKHGLLNKIYPFSIPYSLIITVLVNLQLIIRPVYGTVMPLVVWLSCGGLPLTKISHRLILMLIGSQEYGYNMVARCIYYYVYTCPIKVVTTKIDIWRISVL